MASTTMIGADAAVDMAVLGLLSERPRPVEELVGAVKAVGGERFTPTAAFIEGRLAQLLEAGCLERQHEGERQHGGERQYERQYEQLRTTRFGAAHLARLLCLEVDPGAAALAAFCTTLKLSLLDLVGPESRREVVASLLQTGRRRASALRMARWADGADPVVQRCLALEREREAHELRWLQEVMASARSGEGIGAAVA